MHSISWHPFFLLKVTIINIYQLYSLNFQFLDGISLTSLIQPHFFVCPKPIPGFPTSYVMVFLYSVSLSKRWLFVFWYWWNCWPSLFKLSFHIIHVVHPINRPTSNYSKLSSFLAVSNYPIVVGFCFGFLSPITWCRLLRLLH